MLQVSVIINFEYIFTVSISLVMEYFIFLKVNILIIKYRLHTRLPHPFLLVDTVSVSKHNYTSVCIYLADIEMKFTWLSSESSLIAAYIFKGIFGSLNCNIRYIYIKFNKINMMRLRTK